MLCTYLPSPVWLFVTPMDCSLPGYSVRGDSPGNNTGLGCHTFLQGIFLTQGSNSGLPHCILSKPPGKLKNTGVGSHPFSRVSSWPWNWTRVSCIIGGFFTTWTMGEALKQIQLPYLRFSSVQSLSHVQLFATPWTAAHQASLSITNSWSLPKPRSIRWLHQLNGAEAFV